ncbi:hypothetical protein [Deinococcus misasensis]|uniref:hypothetical protein n=1 Tax=Deinococcus misasensis TaxID=392413 RepID=UPI00054F4F58|nr:hypothetical protein [Deinococcus misasensis]
MTSWRELEASIPFDQLPAFYQKFLLWRGLNPENMNLRRTQQRVYAELNQMVLEGKATKEGEDYLFSGPLPVF